MTLNSAQDQQAPSPMDRNANSILQQPAESASEPDQDRVREVTLLSHLLRIEEERNEELADRLAWSSAVHECLLEQPRWWPILSPGQRRERQLRRLKAAGLFDYQAYLKRYPDVQESGIDPLSHYLSHGLREGRSRAYETGSADRG